MKCSRLITYNSSLRTIKHIKPMQNINETRRSIELDFYSGEIDNSEIVELLKLCDELLQLKTVPNYAKIHKLSPHGVYKCRKNLIVEIAGKKFVLDNE